VDPASAKACDLQGSYVVILCKWLKQQLDDDGASKLRACLTCMTSTTNQSSGSAVLLAASTACTCIC
jgi:hypothetical protein